MGEWQDASIDIEGEVKDGERARSRVGEKDVLKKGGTNKTR